MEEEEEEVPSPHALARSGSLGAEALRAILGLVHLPSSPGMADLMAMRDAIAAETAQDLAARARRAAEHRGSGEDVLADVLRATAEVAQSKPDRMREIDVNTLVDHVKRAKRSYGDACDALLTVLETLSKV